MIRPVRKITPEDRLKARARIDRADAEIEATNARVIPAKLPPHPRPTQAGKYAPIRDYWGVRDPNEQSTPIPTVKRQKVRSRFAE